MLENKSSLKNTENPSRKFKPGKNLTIDEVKAAAQFITKPNTEDGVAFAINKYVNN